jgi:orotate phosphoribosyltransferase
MNLAFNDPITMLTQAMRGLEGIQFDTLVGRGISGCMAAPIIARAMSKNFLIVRKENDGSHSGSAAEGSIGSRWIFVDDCISSGNTQRACMAVVERLAPKAVYVGAWLYQTGNYAELGYWVPAPV